MRLSVDGLSCCQVVLWCSLVVHLGSIVEMVMHSSDCEFCIRGGESVCEFLLGEKVVHCGSGVG